jgi:hypothetical protein
MKPIVWIKTAADVGFAEGAARSLSTGMPGRPLGRGHHAGVLHARH